MSEYLDPAEWLHLAEQLERGGKAMHKHTCGAGNKLLIENKDKGFAAWCYRCSVGGFVPHPQPSLSERIAALREQRSADIAVESDPRPPMPANFDPSTWPLEPRVWLYKSGLSNATIKAHGFYWCERIKRVVLPVLDGSKLVYWQARSLDADRVKYINPKNASKDIFAKYGDTGPVVVTEDILSAVKVGQVVQGWAALGTSLTPAQVMQLAAQREVCIWLDNDTAGIKGRARMSAALRALGVDHRIIRSDRDPKMHSLQEIKDLIYGPSLPTLDRS